MTEWKDVSGYAHYQVSNMGDVRTLDRTITKHNGRPMRIKGKLLKSHTLTLCNPTDPKYHYTRNISRAKLVLEVWVRPPRVREIAIHIDGNKSNCALSNLEWGYSYGKNTHNEVVRSDGIVYPSLHVAARAVNSSPSAISLVCRDLRDTASGFGWKYQKKENK